MAEFNTFIKLHRSILDSAVFSDAEVLRLWIYILCKASVEDRDLVIDGRVIHLKKGQFITGRKKLAAHLGTSESKAYRSLKLLKELKCVDIKVNNKFSLVTVVNWAKFQGTSGKSEQQNNSRTTAERQQINNRRTTDEQQTNTNKNVKELNNVKNDRMKDRSIAHSSEREENEECGEKAFQQERGKMKLFKGSLFQGAVMLSEEQLDDLCEKLSIEEIEKYGSIVRDCELKGKHFKKPHYQAILEMAEKDRQIKN